MKISRCKNCGYVEIEKITWKTRTWKSIKTIFIIFILLTSVIGTTGLYNFIQTRVFEDPNLVFSIGQFYAFSVNLVSNFQSNNKKIKLKEIANNLTKECKDTDEYCKARKIYDELNKFDYRDENATNLDPIIIWNERLGDCDQMSYLFMSLASTQGTHGIKSMLSCNTSHCWIVAHLKNPKKTIIIDLTGEGWVEK